MLNKVSKLKNEKKFKDFFPLQKTLYLLSTLKDSIKGKIVK